MAANLAATRASVGKPVPTPVSVFQIAGADNASVVATIGTDQITLGEVNNQLDLQLALEELQTGQVLYFRSSQGRDELARRRTHVIESLVDEQLLLRAARGSGISEPTPDTVNEQVALITQNAGGDVVVARLLDQHGVTRDYFRVLTADSQGSPGQILQRWLAQEKARMTVVIQEPNG